MKELGVFSDFAISEENFINVGHISGLSFFPVTNESSTFVHNISFQNISNFKTNECHLKME